MKTFSSQLTETVNKIIYYTSEGNTNDYIKGQAIQITNMIINYAMTNKQYKILTSFTKQGIFENLYNLIKSKLPLIKAQIKLFLNSVKAILKNSDKKDVNFNKIHDKYKKLEENYIFYPLFNF